MSFFGAFAFELHVSQSNFLYPTYIVYRTSMSFIFGASKTSLCLFLDTQQFIFIIIPLLSVKLYMSSRSCTPAYLVCCLGCHKTFKRLSTHLSQNEGCRAHYSSTASKRKSTPVQTGHDEITDAPQQRNNSVNFRNAKRAQGITTTAAHGLTKKSSSIPTKGRGTVAEGDVAVDNAEDEMADVDDDFGSFDDALPCEEAADTNHSNHPEGAPDRHLLDLYQEMQELQSNPLGLDRFSVEEKVHIELLNVLKELRAPMKAFSHILNWAAKANDKGHLFKVDCQPSREKVVQNLYCRYNMRGLTPKEKLLYLPYSRRVVPMIYFDARQVFASLLSCPLLNRDENYLFDSPAKDPFAPPTRSTHIGDINTGRCYRKTYEALVKTKDVDMILPAIMAMDKTQVDTYGRLQMEPMTISHGLTKHSIRSKHTAMRILGYICHSPAHQPSSKGGVVVVSAPPRDLPPGTVVGCVPLKPIPDVTWSTYLLNEMHMQIQFILEESGFLDLQRNGFHWMLHYNNKIFPVVLHPYIPFIIGDTEGHDRLCGHYTARFSKIKQLCRACECPTLESGYSKAKYRHRKPAVINRLVRSGNLLGLQGMSQNYLSNGFNKARFGLHNDRGIFGACPGEMLHLVSLGWFKYCLEAFSAQAGGRTSLALKKYDSLCASLGKRLSRHSDRDLPRMNFPKGFSSGANLMGHEITGCLLVKLFALHTTEFKRIFTSPSLKKKPKKKPNKKPKKKSKQTSVDTDMITVDERKFCYEDHISDWILVVSSLLQWHQWMKQPTIRRHQVERSQYAVQWLMRLVADVAPRPKKMGNNTIKTHLVLHLCEDILDHGVPDNVNSAYAESAHIPMSKLTSRNTQKRAKTFTRQAAERYVENLAISSAWHDMERDVCSEINGRPPQEEQGDTESSTLAGRRFTISWSAGDMSPVLSWNRKYAKDNPRGDTLLPSAMQYLAQYCLPHIVDGKLQCHTEFLCSAGQKYRAHPNIYDGKAWHDHAMVTWRGYKYPLPALIHTFVDLRSLPPRARITLQEMGQQPPIKAGVYALIHSFDAINEEATRKPTNVMIGQYKLHLNDHDGTPTLYLVEVHNLVSPTIGIRDIDSSASCEDDHYLFLFRRKKEWASSWDSMIGSCYTSRDSPSIEEAYEVAAVNDKDDNDDDDDDNEGNEDNEDDDDDDDNDEDEEDDDDEDDDDNDDDDGDDGNDSNAGDDGNDHHSDDDDGDKVHDKVSRKEDATPQPRKKKQRRQVP